MADYGQASIALAALHNPATSPEDLSAIATAQPNLWVLVAQHPNAYPDLLRYLDQYGDDAVKAAVAERSEPSPVHSTSNKAASPGAGKKRVLIIAGACVVVLVCVALVLWFLVIRPGRSSDVPTPSPTTLTSSAAASPSPTPSVTPTPTPSPIINPLIATDPPVDATMTSLTVPSLPQLPLDPIQATGSDSAPNIQKFADDVAAGNVDTLVSNCWTQPAEDIRTVYGSPTMRGAILQALQQPMTGTQRGTLWTGSYVTVSAYWEEAKSNYPCPYVTWGGTAGLGDFTPEMAQWRITRILGVQDGTPVHTGDGVNYTLLCDQDCSYLWDPHTVEQTYDDSRTVPIMNATPAQWDRLRSLSNAQIVVEHITSGYYRVRASDGSTDALAYFTATGSDWWLPYTLGEID